MDKKRVGQWTALFGGRRSFQEEIKSAVEIRSQWNQRGSQCDIIVDELPGWLPPMWGSDLDWLYLRRPEGVWKTRIPSDIEDGRANALYQKGGVCSGSKLLGGMSMGRSIVGQPGWIKGADVANPRDAASRDEALHPCAQGADVDADALAWWINPWEEEASGVYVLDAGDHFSHPPAFELEGEWLIAIDDANGRRVAYPTEDGLLDLVKDGRLWLRFGSKWLEPFKVQIAVRS